MIVVTTPTGQIGAQVLEQLALSDEEIRVIVRDAQALPEDVRARVDTVEGSHGDREVVDRAFDGANSVFWLVPPPPNASSVYDAYVGFSIPGADALVHRGVERVVTVSALGRGQQRYAGNVSASLAMDDLIASTGVHLRSLTMPSFMDNIARQVGVMQQSGTLSSPIAGDVRMPTCATKDIAAVAARLLSNPTWEGQAAQAVLGPEDLSFDDMAGILGDVLGTPIRFAQTSPEEYRSRFEQRGTSPAMAQGMLDMAMAKGAGLDNVVVRTAENASPTTFRQWAQDVLRPAFNSPS